VAAVCNTCLWSHDFHWKKIVVNIWPAGISAVPDSIKHVTNGIILVIFFRAHSVLIYKDTLEDIVTFTLVITKTDIMPCSNGQGPVFVLSPLPA